MLVSRYKNLSFRKLKHRFIIIPGIKKYWKTWLILHSVLLKRLWVITRS